LYRITEVLELARGFGQRGLKSHDVRRRCPGGGVLATEQFQCARDVSNVFLPGVSHALLRVEIEIAIGQAEATLGEMDRHHLAVLLILAYRETEESVHPERLQREGCVESALRGFHRVDALKLGLQRDESELLGFGGVHGG